MNTFQLECFLAVADNLSFAAAAQQLHITQPAVTQQIQSLEKELNVKLFARSTRSVKITRQGVVFLYDARHILAIADRMTKRFENDNLNSIKILSIGCYDYFCLFLMIDILKNMKEDFPQLHPKLPVVPFNHIYRLLDDEELEAVVAFKEAAPLKMKAWYKELAKIPLVCICSPDSSLAQKESISLDELDKEKLVLFTPTKAPRNIDKIHGELMVNRVPGDFYFCESAQAIMVLILAGYGVSVLPDIFVPSNQNVAKIPIKDAESLSFGVYYKSLQSNVMLKEFINRMREKLSGLYT